jgi:hypothetical protein
MPQTASDRSADRTLAEAWPPDREWIWPPRPPDATAAQLDLAKFYNAPLHPNWDDGLFRGDLPDIPPGIFSTNGLKFDIRGVIQLNGGRMQGLRADLPSAITNIPVNQLVRRIHLLGTAYNAPASVSRPREIAQIRLHYAGERTADLPIDLGENIEDWWSRPRAPVTPKRADVVWRGVSSSSETALAWQQICHLKLDNPRPDAVVMALDIISTMEIPSVFVMAITLE